MRLAVRLAMETRKSIEELKKVIQETGHYDNLILTNGFIVNQAYLDCKKITEEKKWSIIINSGPQVNERAVPKTRTDLQLSETTIEGIKFLKSILPEYTSTKYVTTSFVIRMIVRGSLMIRNNLI